MDANADDHDLSDNCSQHDDQNYDDDSSLQSSTAIDGPEREGRYGVLQAELVSSSAALVVKGSSTAADRDQQELRCSSSVGDTRSVSLLTSLQAAVRPAAG